MLMIIMKRRSLFDFFVLFFVFIYITVNVLDRASAFVIDINQEHIIGCYLFVNGNF